MKSGRILSIHSSILEVLHRRSSDSDVGAFFRELFAFGYKQTLSCLFPAFIFSILAVSRFVQVPGVPRYDLLLALCLGMQWFMYRSGIESKHEVCVICVFHFLGVSMELFKVHHGSWSYPESAYSKLFGVPLYSGFMYASVASYICQAWRHFDLRFTCWPQIGASAGFGAAIYGNFYLNAYIVDLRVAIIPLLLWGFRKTWVHFETNGIRRAMPMGLSFLLIAFFVWIAENFGTLMGAWRYPHQGEAWSMVKLQLITSWFLLVIVSVIIVAMLKSAKNELLVHSKNTFTDQPVN